MCTQINLAVPGVVAAGSVANPATRGGYISVYVTGFGAFNAASPDGLQRLTYPVTATIWGAANVVYAGEAPGGNGVSTQAGVTVAIQ